MKTEERDRFLTEALGECWHEWDTTEYFQCFKCKEYHTEAGEINNSFSTWDSFGKLWVWAQKQKWWKRFCNERYYHKYYHDRLEDIDYDGVFYVDEVDPDIFADAVYEFLREHK